MSHRRPKNFAEEDWQRLLDALISARNLIPILGEELSSVQLADGSEVPWHMLLAQELNNTGAIAPDAPPLDWPNDYRLRDSSFAGEVADVNARLLRRVLDGELRHRAGEPPRPADLRLCEPLRLLAKITDFPLIATTASDGLLVLALRIEAGEHDATMPVQPDWSRRVVPLHVRTKAAPGDADLPKAWTPAPGKRTPVYHFFGLLRFLPGECALRDSEQLEKIIELVGARLHSGILAEFARCDILMLGTHVPDCLAAAFIRLVKGCACHEATANATIASKTPTRPADPSLLGFLGTYGRTKLFDTGDADAFIRELHARWSAAAARPAAAVDVIADDQCQPPEYCVFLSYASEDRALAHRVYDCLTAKKIPVWFDRTRLEGGEQWDPQLRHAVERCRLFLPIITHNSARAPGALARYYLKEWTWASDLAPAKTGTPYLLPLFAETLDATSTAYIEKLFPRFIAGQGFVALDELISEAGIAKLEAAYRKAEGTPRFLAGPAASV